jgi:hypothetical protein
MLMKYRIVEGGHVPFLFSPDCTSSIQNRCYLKMMASFPALPYGFEWRVTDLMAIKGECRTDVTLVRAKGKASRSNPGNLEKLKT